MRAKTCALLLRKPCLALRARTRAGFRGNTTESTKSGGRPTAAALVLAVNKAYVLALNTAHVLRCNKAAVLALINARVLRPNSKSGNSWTVKTNVLIVKRM